MGNVEVKIVANKVQVADSRGLIVKFVARQTRGGGAPPPAEGLFSSKHSSNLRRRSSSEGKQILVVS